MSDISDMLDTVAISLLPEAIVPGARVMVHGLTKRPDLNGKKGFVVAGISEREDRVPVRLAFTSMRVRRENLSCCVETPCLQDVLQGCDLQSLIFSQLVSAMPVSKTSAAAALVCTEWHMMLDAAFKHMCVSTWSLKLSPDAEALPSHIWRRYFLDRYAAIDAHLSLMQRAEDLTTLNWAHPRQMWPYFSNVPSQVAAAVDAGVAQCTDTDSRKEWRLLVDSVYCVRAEWTHRGGGVDRPKECDITCRIYSAHNVQSVETYVSYSRNVNRDPTAQFERGIVCLRTERSLCARIPDEPDEEADESPRRLFSCVSTPLFRSPMSQDDGAAGVRTASQDGRWQLFVSTPDGILVRSLREAILQSASKAPLYEWWRFLLAACGMQTVTESCGRPKGWLHRLVRNELGLLANQPYAPSTDSDSILDISGDHPLHFAAFDSRRFVLGAAQRRLHGWHADA